MTIELTDEQKVKLLNSDDVFTVMQDILLREEKIDQDREHLWMIGLANNNQILYVELVSLGSLKATAVEPMNVYRVAVLKGAVKVIIAHNHPSGELKPSESDEDITDRLIQVGRILNIEVIDHLIISTRSYLSFADTGLLSELEKSTKWVPHYKLIEQIRKEEKRIRKEVVKSEKEKAKVNKERAVKKEKLEIAKSLLENGVSIEIITKSTGLSVAEIEKIENNRG